jgi:hypothetical protein
MNRHSVRRLAALATALLLVSALAASGAAVGDASAATTAVTTVTQTEGDAPNDDEFGAPSADGDDVTPPTRCFAGDGYPISIGETGATIDVIIHLSMLTDPVAGNEFGIEAAGALADEPIVTLAAGVRLTVREAVRDGIDPFAAFEVLYAYELDLPMFDGAIGDSEYDDETAPIESGARTVAC